MRPAILFFLTLCVLPLQTHAQDKLSFKTTEVAPGILMIEGVGGFTGGNLGVLTGKDGAVLIDDGMQPLFEKTFKEIRKQAGKDIGFVVNTHAHGDHIGGNEGLSKAGATIIGHENLRQRLVDEGVSAGRDTIAATKHWLPEITFADGVNLYLNGQTIQIIHMANAHTDGDSVVYFPDADVIHTGDCLFNGLFPYIDLDSGGSINGYLAAQQKILLMAGDDTVIIPGHGPVASKDDLQAAHTMLSDARDRVQKLLLAGKTEADILKINPLSDYDSDWSWGFINTETMTKTLIRGLSN